MDALEILLTASFWAAAIRIASPLIFATMGELICERAGVLNLGIEGIMTAGRVRRLVHRLCGRRPLDRRAGRRTCRCAVRPAARRAHCAARPVAACGRHRRHATRDEPDLLHLPAGAARSHVAAQDHTVPASAIFPAFQTCRSLVRRCSARRRSPIWLSPPSRSSPGCSTARRSGLRCGRPARTLPPSRRKASASPRSAWARSWPAAR